MYICICKAVTGDTIRAALACGVTSLDDLRNGLGVTTGCGGCVERVELLLAECGRVSSPSRLKDSPSSERTRRYSGAIEQGAQK